MIVNNWFLWKKFVEAIILFLQNWIIKMLQNIYFIHANFIIIIKMFYVFNKMLSFLKHFFFFQKIISFLFKQMQKNKMLLLQ